MKDGFILSFQLFSRLPSFSDIEFSKKNIKYALYFMPLVGLFIGFVVAQMMNLFSSKTEYIQGGVGLFTYYIISGGLHLDGLSDMADGFFANKDKETTLAIMSDSFLGVFGTLTLLMYCILKFSSYMSLVDNLDYVMAVSFMSRITNLYLIKRCTMAKKEGFGMVMKESIGKYTYVLVALGFLIFVLMGDLRLIIAYITMILSNEIILAGSNRKIGGLTGDIFGAGIEINEIIGLLILT